MLDAKALEASRAAYQSAIPDGAWHANGGETDAPIRAAITAYIQAVGPEPAVAVRPLEWEENHAKRSDEDPITEVVGFEAETAFGTFYTIDVGVSYFFVIYDFKAIGQFETERDAKAAAQADYASRIRSALVATPPAEQHPDDIAVDRFAEAMKAKLKWEREQRNRSGWQAMSAADLSRILYEHLPKGDPVDVANLSMMLHQNGQQIETPPAEPVVEEWREIEQHVQPRLADGYTAVAISKPGFWMVKGPGPAAAIATKPAVKDDETVVALRKRVAEIADDFIPDRDADAPQALAEMREALLAALAALGSGSGGWREDHIQRFIEALCAEDIGDPLRASGPILETVAKRVLDYVFRPLPALSASPSTAGER